MRWRVPLPLRPSAPDFLVSAGFPGRVRPRPLAPQRSIRGGGAAGISSEFDIGGLGGWANLTQPPLVGTCRALPLAARPAAQHRPGDDGRAPADTARGPSCRPLAAPAGPSARPRADSEAAACCPPRPGARDGPRVRHGHDEVLRRRSVPLPADPHRPPRCARVRRSRSGAQRAGAWMRG